MCSLSSRLEMQLLLDFHGAAGRGMFCAVQWNQGPVPVMLGF